MAYIVLLGTVWLVRVINFLLGNIVIGCGDSTVYQVMCRVTFGNQTHCRPNDNFPNNSTPGIKAHSEYSVT